MFPARPPKFPYRDHPDEAEDLSGSPLVTSLEEAVTNAQVSHLAAPGSDDDTWINSFATLEGKYLWLVRPDDVKITLESGALRRRVSGGPIKHTNLTAGQAHSGGELWFRDDRSVYVNGGSARFTPRGPGELDAVVTAFKAAGYSVCSFGWSDERGEPRRVLRKADVKWL